MRTAVKFCRSIVFNYLTVMKNKIFLLSTAAFLFSGVGFSQTGKDSTSAKAKEKKETPKSCSGKTCGKKKSN